MHRADTIDAPGKYRIVCTVLNSTRLFNPILMRLKRKIPLLNRPQATKRRYHCSRSPLLAKIQKGYHMSSFTNPIATSTPFTRSLAIAALMGATMLLSPLTAARADSATTAAIQLAQTATTPAAPASPTAKGATGGPAVEAKGETIDQRITNLHAALKITPDEETNWNAVAQTMRKNASIIQRLVSERAAQAPETLTAVQDLKGYEKFARAHYEGLKGLVASFETLYNSMPDPQRKVADEVFQSYTPKPAASK